MKLDWPQTRSQLEAMHWRFEYRTRCKGPQCRRTIEFWKTASLPPQLIPLEEAFKTDSTQLVPHHMLCPDVKQFRSKDSSAKEVEQEKQAQTADREAILRLLQAAGPEGVSNERLNETCLRYAARIFELRKLGFAIETKKENRGVYRFILRGEKESQRRLFA